MKHKEIFQVGLAVLTFILQKMVWSNGTPSGDSHRMKHLLKDTHNKRKEIRADEKKIRKTKKLATDEELENLASSIFLNRVDFIGSRAQPSQESTVRKKPTERGILLKKGSN